MEYPTDIGLLLAAMRKIFDLIVRLSASHGLSGWQKSNHNFKKIKKLFRKAQQAKRSKSNDPKKKEQQDKVIIAAHQAYIDIAAAFLKRINESIATLRNQEIFSSDLTNIDHFILHANRQINQIRRRVINGEVIPHNEKVFSIFEEHTEWISKGKAGVPVELGLKVCIVEDQYGFILYHHIMRKQTDDQVTVFMVEETQKRFPDLTLCSFDKGFYSPENKKVLKGKLEMPILPKKGRLSKQDQDIEFSEEFVKGRRRHSAIESAINALEVHGLDKCPDHGIDGFVRYVALAVVARNVQQLGSILLKRQRKSTQNGLSRKKAA